MRQAAYVSVLRFVVTVSGMTNCTRMGVISWRRAPGIVTTVRYGVASPHLRLWPTLTVTSAERCQPSAVRSLAKLDVETGSFHEHFTQTDYWKRQTIDLPAPAAGSYTVAIWHPDGASGKYVLSTGYKEVFGPLDLLRFPGWWWQVRRYFGQFGGRGV